MTKHKKHVEGEEPKEKKTIKDQEQQVKGTSAAEEKTAGNKPEEEQAIITGPSLEEQLAESKDRYLRLSAEFDNLSLIHI